MQVHGGFSFAEEYELRDELLNGEIFYSARG
jgi:hypothetical protein